MQEASSKHNTVIALDKVYGTLPLRNNLLRMNFAWIKPMIELSLYSQFLVHGFVVLPGLVSK